MMDQRATAYDRISYPGHPFGETHPDHVATLGLLFGMSPAPLNSCRVLELGCGDGANLIPVAFQWPDSKFVGLDLSEQAVRKGNELIARLGLRNIVLRSCDIMDVSAQFGTFDYIIAHGVYSWVPVPVRAKILSIFHANLSAQGIGYVSYNCYPGCHARDIAREMMRYHVRGVSDPRQRVAQSRALLTVIAQTSAENSTYGFELRNQLDRIKDTDDQVLFHDDLSEVATPFYLHQVAEEAARHGLQYLCDAAFSLSRFERLPALAREALASIPEDDAVTREQYADFIEARSFRESLFCHDAIELNRSIDPRCVTKCHLGTSAMPPDGPIDPAAGGMVTFKTDNGSTLTTDHCLSKAVIQTLGRVWPQTVGFAHAMEEALSSIGPAAERVKANLDQEVDTLTRLLFRAFSAGQFELHLFPPPLTTTLAERPQASLLARRQAETALAVTNLRHRTVSLKDETVRRFLMLVDGTRTLDELVIDLNAVLESNGNGAKPGVPREAVEKNLGLLAKLGLLAASAVPQ
jgi:methyltransferase-like protein/cyclopropane fatty-acyl-phospholipid synthase-like methyltransferase